MSSALFARTIHYLRLLALAVLVLGMLAKPVLVAACEVDDLCQSNAGTPSMTHDTGDRADDGCCPSRICGECCTASAMLPVTVGTGQATPLDTCPHSACRVESEPASLPVEHRPPIRA